ncbi:cyclin-dependent kinase 7-like [Varroa jacobsoni]|uniref:Cyclin-dependent kinase 7 n=2 Tax=Varroa destructor TaxID=109461 RepID=A0A7M7MBW9_VARDE|nr:cyclin-dependent kinase 7-like isoform X1 [Varroa destructor]XP_022650704.1 cyclin-dependent kinase 7-like isoform X1 [Varroa destructor]XP_022650706.1 cyclin-dependent kinase 7-like isoform X1 [Varroa destructor]XP_022650707.1 cyclin-dependent kinase 7-like isoform X1 [Varroa destructor]XP_022650708.1 cyclin-dependent kinase 7-like isoform X1 [Varroa destructor]XP_022688214.1 cyclin-dependent kinase 7-like [Varroa jacobsoni]XP_022688215.1 cyclin-dependent kinase 7-like [Varroa jacobsoni]
MADIDLSAETRYQKIEYLGEGQFATVFKAKDANTGNIVAVKKIKLGSRAEARDGINRTALREIKLMQELQHENVLSLLDVFGQKSDISLVFDFMITDLEAIIKDSRIILYPAHVKCYILQCLRGLEYLHHNWILHRDLKPNNLLVDDKGILKIGDFGLAKFFGSPTRIYTHQVVTRWYRSPELLFGARIYGTGVDMWAMGCILAELLLRVPFLAGETDLDQVSKIFQCMGTPTEETWPGITQLPDYVEFKTFPATPFEVIFTAAGDDLLELLHKLLAMDPLQRCTCTEALKMSYFSNKPHPCEPIDLPLPSKHKKEQENKRKVEQSAEQESSVPRKIRF